MFTGIVQGMASVAGVRRAEDIVSIDVLFPEKGLDSAQIGASVSIDGCCLTITKIAQGQASFDLMGETLRRTTFFEVKQGRVVNFERSLRFGDEVGGHVLSGHVDCVAEVMLIEDSENTKAVTFRVEPYWTKYLFDKGYVAVNGVSLTLTRVDKKSGEFSVSLIPETLKQTTFGAAVVGQRAHIEIDRNTQAIVDTVERIVPSLIAARQKKGCHTID